MRSISKLLYQICHLYDANILLIEQISIVRGFVDVTDAKRKGE